MNLSKILKTKKMIQTDIGDFEYVKILGEGGNSFVFHFKKGNADFAIKFLKATEDSKINRFKDEYFCAAQIPSHKNIARSYHFDKIILESNEYFIIIMKYYDSTLGSKGTISSAHSEEKTEEAWALFLCLANALCHLHTNKIIHRDIKPQNVFFDSIDNEYVIGDLGIAHFSDDKFDRESKTKPSERMANFGFSAPEQINSKGTVQASCDIYSMGQVLYWYLTGSTIRGLEMAPLSNSDSPDNLRHLELIIKKCLINDPSKRFQSISEISQYLKDLKKPARYDYWPVLHSFDETIRRSMPKIKDLLEIKDINVINRFFNNFREDCNPEDFWYMSLEGGDNTFTGVEHISESSYLFCGMIEVNISKLLVYRDSGYPYKNFFILLLEPSSPFELINDKGNSIKREINKECSQDYATLWNERYIDYKETENGYYEFNGEVLRVDSDLFKDRIRHLKKYAYIVVPKGTATACMVDRTPTERFLERVVNTGTIEKDSLRSYKNETQSHHSPEITMYN
ncbi:MULTISPECIES: serine/threonine protein kinase [unclassified Brenneria]|uniref:serine/threonine protein kinase n=1 Tax=unclassified Brenneria TaxID=2634434 RepID=UPI001552F2CA|nr:protein kinase [Brenneria sp. hezel4-2-4]MEE3652926.1 protein kinase [Brenneria sp. HEZEL_4_2_4]NPD02880.1 protein kinase [Brenneria sp. hezel4-2-4]